LADRRARTLPLFRGLTVVWREFSKILPQWELLCSLRLPNPSAIMATIREC